MAVHAGPFLLRFAYPLLPWFGVMSLGFGISRVFELAPARRDDQEPRGPGCTEHLRILRGEVGGIAGGEHLPGQRVPLLGVQRLAQDDDGALAVRGDEDQVARVRPGAVGGVDARGRRLDTRAHLGGGLVVAQCREQVHLAGRLRQLEEGDAAAASRKGAQVGRVRDVARSRDARHAPQRDVLDVPDDRDAHRAADLSGPSAAGIRRARFRKTGSAAPRAAPDLSRVLNVGQRRQIAAVAGDEHDGSDYHAPRPVRIGKLERRRDGVSHLAELGFECVHGRTYANSEGLSW